VMASWHALQGLNKGGAHVGGLPLYKAWIDPFLEFARSQPKDAIKWIVLVGDHKSKQIPFGLKDDEHKERKDAAAKRAEKKEKPINPAWEVGDRGFFNPIDLKANSVEKDSQLPNECFSSIDVEQMCRTSTVFTAFQSYLVRKTTSDRRWPPNVRLIMDWKEEGVYFWNGVHGEIEVCTFVCPCRVRLLILLPLCFR
jgi:hypothetical protein